MTRSGLDTRKSRPPASTIVCSGTARSVCDARGGIMAPAPLAAPVPIDKAPQGVRLRLRAGKKARRGDGEARSGAGDAETPRGADDVEPALFGRDADIEALLESEAPVTVLAGDSGVGKSAVLRALPGTSRGVLAARTTLLLHI